MISVVLATYNEETNIQRCLQSVQSFADEIIVVDGESTDKTRKIAKQLGARVYKTTNKPNFHINKQMAMDKAKGELVLQMDADEVVDTELQKFIEKTYKKIQSYKNSTHETSKLQDAKAFPKAWWIKRKNYFLGTFLKKGGQYPDPVIRLYVNGYARLPQKDVHEQMEVDGEVAWAKGHLLHYSNPTFKDYVRKWNAYTSLKATQLKDENIKITFFHTLKYIMWRPVITFLSLFIRHKGFVDRYAGFVFALMSGLYWPTAYIKLWELYEKKKK